MRGRSAGEGCVFPAAVAAGRRCRRAGRAVSVVELQTCRKAADSARIDSAAIRGQYSTYWSWGGSRLSTACWANYPRRLDLTLPRSAITFVDMTVVDNTPPGEAFSTGWSDGVP